jgi:hypothetical protein
VSNEPHARLVSGNHRVSSTKRDIRPTLAINYYNVRNLEGTVLEKLDGFESIERDHLTRGAAVSRLGLPEPNETVSTPAITDRHRDYH